MSRDMNILLKVIAMLIIFAVAGFGVFICVMAIICGEMWIFAFVILLILFVAGKLTRMMFKDSSKKNKKQVGEIKIDLNKLGDEGQKNIAQNHVEVSNSQKTNTDFLLRAGCAKEIIAVVEYMVKSQAEGISLEDSARSLKNVGWSDGDINNAIGVAKEHSKVLFEK